MAIDRSLVRKGVFIIGGDYPVVVAKGLDLAAGNAPICYGAPPTRPTFTPAATLATIAAKQQRVAEQLEALGRTLAAARARRAGQ